jgi:G patch domain-containing protein 1
MPAPEDSPGIVLLKKMGWRPGQGVGPRVTWRQRKIQDILASGRSLNGVDVDKLAEDEDSEALKHMFPPRDTVAPVLPRKKDVHGLGYAPGGGLEPGSQQGAVGKGPKVSGAHPVCEYVMARLTTF